MAVVEQSEAPFVRQDGKDKVTGLGRYTADMTLTGMLHARFRYADHTHARIVSIDTGRARELPGVFAVITARARPRRPLRPLRAGPAAVREGGGAVRGRDRGGGRGPHPRDRPAGVRADRRRLRAAAGGHRHRGGARRRRAAGARGVGPLLGGRRAGAGAQQRLALDHRQGRRRTGAGRGRRGRPRALCGRHVPRRPDRAAGDRGRVERRQGDDLVVHPGALHRPRRGRHHAGDAARPTCGSSSPTSAAASAASASSTSRRMWRRSPAPPAGRCGWCSRAGRSSPAPTTAARAR